LNMKEWKRRIEGELGSMLQRKFTPSLENPYLGVSTPR